MKKLIIILVVFMFIGCNNEKVSKLKSGNYIASLQLTDKDDLPFTFKVINEQEVQISNGQEVIEVTDITYKNDSVYITMPVFDSYFVAKVDENGLMNGSFVKKELKRIVPFTSSKSEERFTTTNDPKYNITGNWETTFSPDKEEGKYIAKGIFKQKDNVVTGTFRTTTGDYRFLEGVLDGDELKLSTFDGAHAFLFTAKVNDSTMNGTFYSGNHWKEPFTAKRNEGFTLPDANTLTEIKKDAEKFTFSFPDADGNMVSLNDERFKDKVVLVQIFGTWCPNCLDESRFYTDYYNQHKEKGLEIVALAFEYVKTKEKAFKNIAKFKKDIGVEYPTLLAQYGTTNKKKAQEKLPMLNHVLSYPTTIFIDKKGDVRKIHTGFNGPATGEKYVEFKTEFEKFVNSLLSE